MSSDHDDSHVGARWPAVRVFTVVGSPPIIIGEASIPGRIREDRDGVLHEGDRADWSVEFPGAEHLMLDELTATSRGRRALAAWREGASDAVWDAWYEAHRYDWQVRNVKEDMAAGCPVAADLLRRGCPPAEVDEYESSHTHKDDRPRHLSLA